jgi:hypothetical protein
MPHRGALKVRGWTAPTERSPQSPAGLPYSKFKALLRKVGERTVSSTEPFTRWRN